jgi:hypothetical protein
MHFHSPFLNFYFIFLSFKKDGNIYHKHSLFHYILNQILVSYEIRLRLDITKTPIMVEVEFLFFLLSTMMGAYHNHSALLLFLLAYQLACQ